MSYERSTCWALHYFSNLRIQLNTTILISCPSSVFTQYLLIMTKPKALLCKTITSSGGIWRFNVETLNYFSEDSEQYPYSITIFLKNLKYPTLPHSMLWQPSALQCTIGESTAFQVSSPIEQSL